MKETQFERTNLLIGKHAVDVLKKSRVAVFGLGGVGGMAVESLARIGVGSFLLIDGDVVSPSNLNRQVIATQNSVGRKKTEVMRERVHMINSGIKVDVVDMFVLEENIYDIDLSGVDYVVDAIDTISAKLAIAKRCFKEGIKVISSMGAGNRTSMNFVVGDIFSSSICPIAKIMRRKLREVGVDRLKVVYSLEVPKGHFDALGNIAKSESSESQKSLALQAREVCNANLFDEYNMSNGECDEEVCDVVDGSSDGGGGSVGGDSGEGEVLGGQRKRVRKTIGSIPFAPMCAGLHLASSVVEGLVEGNCLMMIDD